MQIYAKKSDIKKARKNKSMKMPTYGFARVVGKHVYLINLDNGELQGQQIGISHDEFSRFYVLIGETDIGLPLSVNMLGGEVG